MKKLSQIRAWVEWQKSTGHAGIESFVYLLGLIDRLDKILRKINDDIEIDDVPDWNEAQDLLRELQQ